MGLWLADGSWRVDARWQERKEAGQAVTGKEVGAILKAVGRQERVKMSEGQVQEMTIERLRLRKLS